MTDHDRMDEQAQLVEDARCEQRANQRRAAGDRDVGAGLVLAPPQIIGDVATDQLRVLPVDAVERRRCHQLLDAVDLRGKGNVVGLVLYSTEKANPDSTVVGAAYGAELAKLP